MTIFSEPKLNRIKIKQNQSETQKNDEVNFFNKNVFRLFNTLSFSISPILLVSEKIKYAL